MPVRRFHSVEEMTAPREARPFDPANLRAAIALSRTCLALCRKKAPAGVHKHRSVAEADEARRRWEAGYSSHLSSSRPR